MRARPAVIHIPSPSRHPAVIVFHLAHVVAQRALVAGHARAGGAVGATWPRREAALRRAPRGRAVLVVRRVAPRVATSVARRAGAAAVVAAVRADAHVVDARAEQRARAVRRALAGAGRHD